MVIVKEVLPARGYEIGVALSDYDAVLSRLHLIKVLAVRAAGLPEEQILITNLVVNEADAAPPATEPTPKNRIRVVLVDDHAAFRNAIKLLIRKERGMSVVAEAGDGTAALEAVGLHKPDVVILDVRLPQMDGLEATRAITRTHPGTKVIVLTLFTDDGTRVKALEAGAHHCLSKDSHAQGLLAVINGCRSRSLQDALQDVLKSRAKIRDDALISEIPGPTRAFKIEASLHDYNRILSRIDMIKAAAVQFAGMPEEEGFVINLVLSEKSLCHPLS
jgi:DNA-binding NarL/FixJ family response regulator